MRIRDYNSAGKTIAASSTVSFNSNDMDSSQVVAVHGVMTGNTNSLASIDRFRLKANGQTIVDTTPAFIRAFIQRRKGLTYPADTALDNGGSAGVAQAFRRFTIPLCDLGAPTKDMEDTCQFPRGANITVEVQFNSSAVAGSLFLGWTRTNVPPQTYPKLISQSMQISAGNPNGRFNLADEGKVCAFGIRTLGLNRARLVLSGAQVFHLLGQATSSNAVNIDNMFVEADQLWNNITDMQAATAGVPTTFYDPYVVDIDADLAAASGSSYIEIGTDATNWGASGANKECFLFSKVGQG